MCGKCYTITEAQKYDYDITLRFVSVFKGKLHHFVPIITFSISYDKISQNEFLKHYPTPDVLTCTADKLRWYRLKNGYQQKEIAEMIGVYRATYAHFENPDRNFFDLDKLKILAEIYNINVECLLGNYMLFLYKGQGRQIKQLRKSLGVTQRELASIINVPVGTVKQWERERCVMMYENYIKIKNL